MTRGPYRAKPAPGSIADLVIRYRKSPRVLAWKATTRAKNDRILGDFMAANPSRMVADVGRGDIIGARDSLAEWPAGANNWLKVISGLFDYAVDLELIPYSPAAKVKRLKSANPDGFRQWREDELAAFLSHWPLGTLPHRVLTLALYTGAGRIDLVRLGWGNVVVNHASARDTQHRLSLIGDSLRYRRQKTGVEAIIPILPPLAEMLATIPAQQFTFLQTQGRTRSEKALEVAMRRWTAAAGLGDRNTAGHYLGPHGLRKAFGRRMAEAGVGVHAIMSILGLESIAAAQIYTRAYDRARAAEQAREQMAGMLGKEQKVTRLKK